MQDTLYRRPLPAELIAFSSPAGREVFQQALAAGGLEGYFPLAEQFHTQADPAFCGLGSLVVALNAMGVDPGRLWKGPWRWFAEDLLDCCLPLERVRQRGMNLDELACLARCNGAQVQLQRADEVGLDALRAALSAAASGDGVLVVAYDRASLGQTGAGHFSPIGGFHAERDLALILDVARFKYPPHWAAAEALYRAMLPHDPDTGRARGWMSLRASERASSIGFSVQCAGQNWPDLTRRIQDVSKGLTALENLAALATALLPLAPHIEVRSTGTRMHTEALELARSSLRERPAFAAVTEAVGPEHAAAVMLLLWAFSEHLRPGQRAWLGQDAADTLRPELENLRAQLSALVALDDTLTAEAP